jgi:hypothetical protein
VYTAFFIIDVQQQQQRSIKAQSSKRSAQQHDLRKMVCKLFQVITELE